MFLWNMGIAQWKVQPTISISYNWDLLGIYKIDKVTSITNYHYNKFYYVTSIPYQMAKINLGFNVIRDRYSLGISGSYQYFKCRQQLVITPHVKNKHSLNSHFIGLIITNRFRETKIVRPFFSIGLLTEISTDYKGKYLDTEDYDPVKYANTYSMSGSTNVNYYQSTPFIGEFLVGCDFRVYKGFSANLAIGHSVRVLKVQYGMLYYNPSVKDKPITETKIGSPYTINLNYMTLQLGLSYAFDIHKKKQKTEML